MKILNQQNAVIEEDISSSSSALTKEDPLLCNYCLRTASNGIRCMGICVADSEY